MALHSTNRLGSSVHPAKQDSADSYASGNESLRSPEFFRRPSIFKALQKTVYPAILKNHSDGSPIRIWVSGCSTGEHVYSIAMSLVEYLGSLASPNSIRIFGTNVNEEAIQIARRGRFGRGIGKTVSSERLNRFFLPVKRGYSVSPAIRDLCIFATHDIVKDPPFGHLDLLIFYNLWRCSQSGGSERSLIPSFHLALKPHGFLALADGTAIDGMEKLFSVQDPKARLYGRKDVSRRDQFAFWLQPRREMFQSISPSGEEVAQRRYGKRTDGWNGQSSHPADNHHLQQAIETNRELCSCNREILSSNIELQSTAEDLQTKNYELHRAADESEEKFRVFVENAPAAIVMCDEEGKIVSANAQTERIFGYSRVELIGGSIGGLIPEIFGGAYLSNRGTVMFRRTRLLQREALETRARRRDGSHIPVEITVSPIETSHGTLFAAAVMNITERQHADEQARWAAVLEERARVARDIHDTLAQGFAGIILNLEVVEDACANLPADVRDRIQRARDVARQNLEEARRSILALSSRRPGGLTGSIHEMAAQAALNSNTPVRFSLKGTSRPLDGTIEENLFFIARQATDNALQHGRPKIVHIGLSFGEQSICLRVQDDGKGFEARRTKHGFGVKSMRERARYIGCHLLLKSQPGKGTVVKAVVPVTRTSAVVQ